MQITPKNDMSGMMDIHGSNSHMAHERNKTQTLVEKDLDLS